MRTPTHHQKKSNFLHRSRNQTGTLIMCCNAAGSVEGDVHNSPDLRSD